MSTNANEINFKDKNNINFIEIFEIEEIQNLQDLFAETHGVASIITHPDGTPITKPSNFCRLCNDVIRKTEKGLENCIKSDAEIGCFNPKVAIIKKCLSGGLWDAGASINIENKHIANWLIGQVRNEETDFNSIIQYADEIGANRKEFAEAFKEVPEMTSKQFKKVADMLFAFANELSDKAYKNLLLKKQLHEIEVTKQELIKAKEKAESNELETALIIESLAEGIGFVNKDEIFEFVNSASEQIFETNKGELVGKSLYDFLDIEEQINLKNQLLNRKKGLTSTYELKIHTLKGNIKYIQVSATPKLNNAGEYIGAYGAVRDITNQKKSEEALRFSEEKYRLLAENATDIIWTMDINGKYLYISPSVYILLGYKAEKLKNKQFREYLTEDSLKIASKYFKINSDKILSGIKPEPAILTLEILNSDGIPVWTEINISPIYNEFEFKYFLGVTRNIDERKQNEEKALKIKKYYQAIIEKAPDGVALIDDKGVFKYISPSAKRMFAYDANEDIYINPKEQTHPDDLQYVITNLTKLIENPSFTPTLQYRFIDKDGNWKWVETTMRNLLSDENVQAIVLNFRDINDRKIIEQELIKAKEKAEESDKLKTAFLHNISHEIRTPFNGILGFLQFINDNDITTDKRNEFISIINKSSMRLINTINDIVDISQIQAGQTKLSISEVNISELFNELYDFFCPFAENKNLSLIMQNIEYLNNKNIITDYNKLKAIFSFLIDNAIKFTKVGKIEFGIASHNQLPDYTSVNNNQLFFYVKDTGVGIPKDKQTIIFENFMQADVSDTRGYEGSGLGLSISKAYTQMLGGEIFLKSDIGQGSCFYFSINKEVNSTNDDFNSDSNSIILKKKKAKLNILIAEDDETSEIYIHSIIKPISNNIIIAKTGTEAIQLCNNQTDIDLILMDIKMPDMNGDVACSEIRKFNKEVIIIAQTAYAFNIDLQKAKNIGCNDYIAKPLKKDNLINLINKYFTINDLEQ